MKIGFFYPPYYPVTASASVHGYKIAEELVNLGHTLLSCTNDENCDRVSDDCSDNRSIIARDVSVSLDALWAASAHRYISSY